MEGGKGDLCTSLCVWMVEKEKEREFLSWPCGVVVECGVVWCGVGWRGVVCVCVCVSCELILTTFAMNQKHDNPQPERPPSKARQ